MADFVERDKVHDVVEQIIDDDYGYYRARELIDSIPAADVRPVVHSKWVPFPNDGVWDFKCDICHRIIPFGQTPDTMKCCPNCGADMR